MKYRKTSMLLTGLIVLSCMASVRAHAQAQQCTASSNVSVFATGLDNPRGLKFGPDGNLYVAEGGTGGADSTVGQCAQVSGPIGPYSGGFTARISRISPQGVRTTVVGDLPSSQTQPLPSPLVSGVGDIAFVNGTLYGLLAGAGCSHGIPEVPNGVFRVNSDGTTTLIADLGAFQAAHPVANPGLDDFEPDGTWYSMVEVRGDLYAVEPNHGELVKVGTDGEISRVADISASFGHAVPTAIAYHGNFYVGTLGTFANGFNGMVIKITPSGETQVVASDLTSILGLAFKDGQIYALENEGGFPVPCAGRVLRISHSGKLDKVEVIATGLMFPTAMTLGPDGNLYVSTFGYGFPEGSGQIVKITLP